jgi:hypothetical protein
MSTPLTAERRAEVDALHRAIEAKDNRIAIFMLGYWGALPVVDLRNGGSSSSRAHLARRLRDYASRSLGLRAFFSHSPVAAQGGEFEVFWTSPSAAAEGICIDDCKIESGGDSRPQRFEAIGVPGSGVNHL